MPPGQQQPTLHSDSSSMNLEGDSCSVLYDVPLPDFGSFGTGADDTSFIDFSFDDFLANVDPGANWVSPYPDFRL